MAPAAIKPRDGGRGPAVEAIDREHLARMTFGEENLAREILELFDRQAVKLLARMRQGEAESAALAHTLKGSAGGVGAWGVARAAEACERAVGGSAAERGLALEGLARAIDEARQTIAEILAGDGAPRGMTL